MSYSTNEVNTGKKWIDGKAIYRKVVDCGVLPNNAQKTISNALSNVDKIISVKGYGVDNYSTIPIPYVDYYLSQMLILGVSIGNNQDVEIRTNFDASNFSGYITIEYTKTTD